jgi:hypothetical protein
MSSDRERTYELSSDKNDYLEAIKLVNDWSKWIATIETAAIIVIGGLAKDFQAIGDPNITACIAVSLCSFILSIFAATSLLIALPGVAQRLPPPMGKDLGDMKSPRSRLPVSIRLWGSIQQFSFLLGLISFSLLIILVLS